MMFVNLHITQPLLNEDEENVEWADQESSEDSMAGDDPAGSSMMNEAGTNESWHSAGLACPSHR